VQDKWLQINSMSYSMDYDGLIRANFELYANNFDIINALRKSLYSNDTALFGVKNQSNEFMCLWCASPNPLSNRFCSQCGAPRGFILK
jgi:hypothetical protein